MRRIKRSRKKGSIAKAAKLAVAVPQVRSSEKVQAFWDSAFAMGSQLVRTNQEYLRTAASEWLRLWATPWWVAADRPVSRALTQLPGIAAVAVGPTRAQRQRAVTKLVAAGLGPVHKRATANARRLARSNKKR